MFMEMYSPELAPSTTPAWIVELRTRLAAEKKAAKAEKVRAKAQAKQARIQVVIAYRRRTRASRREQFIQWFAASLEETEWNN
jgi:hypothetical protein